MIDEIAIEPRPRYSSKQDAVIGICREHAHMADLHSMSTRPSAVESLTRTKELLDSGQCHRASEATMIAIERFGESNYNPSVIVASGTRKTEKAPDQRRLIELVCKCWAESLHGEAENGEIWAISTDGDSRRRLALFDLCMREKLQPSSDLYQIIGHIPLLNLCCSPTQITHDGDYKHEEKSECHFMCLVFERKCSTAF